MTTNSQTPGNRAVPSLTLERLRELLLYDPVTGVFTRKVRVRSQCAGGRLSSKDGWGYHRVMIDRRNYRLSRLAWFYVHGRWPIGDIDHINGVPADNAISNLREATKSQNSANMRPRRALKGATFDKRRRTWRAKIGVNGESISLGTFGSEQDAHEAYAVAATKYYGQFARAK